MKQLRYKYAPVILATSSLVLWGTSLIIYSYSNYTLHLIWLPFVAIQLLVNYYCGTLIKTLHTGAYKDILTGLPNRRYFYERLLTEMEGAKRNKTPLCLALIDVDDFKKINDIHGHLDGDQALTLLASLLKDNARTIDFLARWGGDEFVLILPQTDLEGAFILAERLRTVVESHPFRIRLTLSIGIVSAADIEDMNQLLEMVDDAMYRAKKSKNVVLKYS